MIGERSRKYLNAIAWFSALWGIKEFIIEPIITKSKKGKRNDSKQISTKN